MVEGQNSFHFDSRKDDWMQEVVKRVEAQGYRVNGPLQSDIEVTKLEPDYYLKGKLQFSVEMPCARCAEAVAQAVAYPFEMAMAQVSTARGRNVTIAEESEELDISFFEGNEIDLVPVIAEQFVLSLPYRFLCGPDCKGICQACGKNLNQGECGCLSAEPLNPFAVLKTLKH